MNFQKLEGRVSKSPYDHSREQARRKLLALKKDLEGILCINGPYDDPDPTKDRQVISMCDEQKQLTRDEILHLKEIFDKHGLSVDVTVTPLHAVRLFYSTCILPPRVPFTVAERLPSMRGSSRLI
jgi:hypothetical protein